MHSTRYIITFTFILTLVSALLLSFLYFGTNERAKLNEKIFNKRAVLAALASKIDKPIKKLSDQEVLDIFETQVEQFAIDMEGNDVPNAAIIERGYTGGLAEDIDMKKEKKKPVADQILPVFIYADGTEKYTIVSVRGNGLWDEIWGNIALDNDYNTVIGVSFDHAGETPGLGAEIKDNSSFPAQFKNKKIYAADKSYKSINVRKGGAKDLTHEVDAISGATVTSDGVSEMLYRGLKYYEPYFNKMKNS